MDSQLEKDLKDMLTDKYKTYLQGIRSGHFGKASAEEHKIIQRTMIKKDTPFVNSISSVNDQGDRTVITEQKEVERIIAKSLQVKFNHDPKW